MAGRLSEPAVCVCPTGFMPIIRRAIAAMGTRFELLLDGGDVPLLHRIAELALAEVEECHRRFSLFSRDSLVSHINRTAHSAPVRVDRETFDLFADCLTVWRESGGAFEITIGPLMAALGFRDQAPVVASAGRADVRDVGSDAIELDSSSCTIRLTRPGISIDLGAIAKGHALDLAAAVLRAHGVERAFLHGGTSSVIAIGAPEACPSGWRISVATPALDGNGTTDESPVVVLKDASLSVSAPHGRMVRRGERWMGHVLDPRTGTPIEAAASAVVIGPSARLADAWSTAALVLGRRPAGLPAEYTSVVLPAPASNDEGPRSRWVVDGPAPVEFVRSNLNTAHGAVA